MNNKLFLKALERFIEAKIIHTSNSIRNPLSVEYNNSLEWVKQARQDLQYFLDETPKQEKLSKVKYWRYSGLSRATSSGDTTKDDYWLYVRIVDYIGAEYEIKLKIDEACYNKLNSNYDNSPTVGPFPHWLLDLFTKQLTEEQLPDVIGVQTT